MSFDPDVHVPGSWRCAKCGFRLQQMNLNAQDGTVTSRDQAGDVCPNDGAPLWRVTWKDDAAEAFDQIQALIDENARLREALVPFANPPLYVFDAEARYVPTPQPEAWIGGGWFSTDDFRRARAVLSPNPDRQED